MESIKIKKILMFIVVICSFLVTEAFAEQGERLFGCSIGYNLENTGSTGIVYYLSDHFAFKSGLDFSYDNKSINETGEISDIRNDITNEGPSKTVEIQKSTSIGGQINLDYYFTPDVPVSLYTGLHLGYSYSWDEISRTLSQSLTSSESDIETSEQYVEINTGTNNITAGLRLGVQFIIQENLVFYTETSINAFLALVKGTQERNMSSLSDIYDRYSTSSYDISNKNFGIDFNNFSLGIIYYF